MFPSRKARILNRFLAGLLLLSWEQLFAVERYSVLFMLPRPEELPSKLEYIKTSEKLHEFIAPLQTEAVRIKSWRGADYYKLSVSTASQEEAEKSLRLLTQKIEEGLARENSRPTVLWPAYKDVDPGTFPSRAMGLSFILGLIFLEIGILARRFRQRKSL